jgi:hypothetical protein
MLGRGGVRSVAIAAAIVSGVASMGAAVGGVVQRAFSPAMSIGPGQPSSTGIRKKSGWTNARYRRQAMKLRNRAKHRRACRG